MAKWDPYQQDAKCGLAEVRILQICVISGYWLTKAFPLDNLNKTQEKLKQIIQGFGKFNFIVIKAA